MLKKELFIIDFIGDTNNLKGLVILFAFFLFGVFYSRYNIETKIEPKNLVDVYGTNPKIEKGGIGKSSYLTFKSTNRKGITYRVESHHIKAYENGYLFSFDQKNKPYKLKVLKTELDHAHNGDVLNLYSILDEKSILNVKRSYLTLEEYKRTNQIHYLESFKVSALLSSIFFVWIIILLIKRKRIRAATKQTAK